MMNRREAIVVLGAAALSAAVAPAIPLRSLLPAGQDSAAATPSPAALSNAEIDKRLRADLQHLSPRVNSEEGVPVFLACVNLLDSQSTPAVAATPLISPNAAIAGRVPPGRCCLGAHSSQCSRDGSR